MILHSPAGPKPTPTIVIPTFTIITKIDATNNKGYLLRKQFNSGKFFI